MAESAGERESCPAATTNVVIGVSGGGTSTSVTSCSALQRSHCGVRRDDRHMLPSLLDSQPAPRKSRRPMSSARVVSGVVPAMDVVDDVLTALATQPEIPTPTEEIPS